MEHFFAAGIFIELNLRSAAEHDFACPSVRPAAVQIRVAPIIWMFGLVSPLSPQQFATLTDSTPQQQRAADTDSGISVLRARYLYYYAKVVP